MGRSNEPEGLTSEEMDRLARKIWGDEIFNENGEWYPSSSSEIEEIYKELVIELKAELRESKQTIARLERKLAKPAS